MWDPFKDGGAIALDQDDDTFDPFKDGGAIPLEKVTTRGHEALELRAGAANQAPLNQHESDFDPFRDGGAQPVVGAFKAVPSSLKRGLNTAGQAVDGLALMAGANLTEDAKAEPARIEAERLADPAPNPANFAPGKAGQRALESARRKWNEREAQRQSRLETSARFVTEQQTGVLPALGQAIGRRQQESAALPRSPGMVAFDQAEGWKEVIAAFARNPVDQILNLGAEGLGTSVPMLVAATAAAPVAGLPGVMAATGGGSFLIEAGNKIVEEFQAGGVDFNDPDTFAAVFTDPERMAQIRSKAVRKGVPIAFFDAASAGVAGRLFRVPAQTVMGKLGHTSAEVGVQMLAGGAGEATGSLAADGEVEFKEVFAEMIGELGTGGAEIVRGVAMRPEARATQADPAQPTRPPPLPDSVQPADATTYATAEAAATGDPLSRMEADLPNAASRDVLRGRTEADLKREAGRRVSWEETRDAALDAVLGNAPTAGAIEALDRNLAFLAEKKGKRRLAPPQVLAMLDNTVLGSTLRGAQFAQLTSDLAADASRIADLRTRLQEILQSPPPAGEPSASAAPAAPGALTAEQRTAARARLAEQQQQRQAEAEARRDALEIERAAEQEREQRAKAERTRLLQIERTGRDPDTGDIVDVSRVPDEELATLDIEAEGLTTEQVQVEVNRRIEAAERAAAQEASGESLLDVLRTVKLPNDDPALSAELKQLIREGMTERQRMTLVRGQPGSLDSTAEVLRADYGFDVNTPAEVLDLVQRALAGEDIRADPTSGDQVPFARREGRRPFLPRIDRPEDQVPYTAPPADELAKLEAEASMLYGYANHSQRLPRGKPPHRAVEHRPGNSPEAPQRSLAQLEALIRRGIFARDLAADTVSLWLHYLTDPEPRPMPVRYGGRPRPDKTPIERAYEATGLANIDEARELLAAVRAFNEGQQFPDKARRLLDRVYIAPDRDLGAVKYAYMARRPERMPARIVERRQAIWQRTFERVAPGVARRVQLAFGDPQALVETGLVNQAELTGQEEAAYAHHRRMLYLFDGALRENTDDITRLNLNHELGHAFFETLDRGTQRALHAQWRAEVENHTGPLYDAEGNLHENAALGVEDSLAEWFAERNAHANDAWSKRRAITAGRRDTLIETLAAQFRELLTRLLEYLESAFGRNYYDDALTRDFRKFLDQGERWNQPRRPPAPAPELAPNFAVRDQGFLDLGGDVALGVDLPPTVRNLTPRFANGRNNYQLRFASTLEQGIYMLGDEGRTGYREQLADTLATQTGLSEGQLRTLGRTLRQRVRDFAFRAPSNLAELRLPPLIAEEIARETGGQRFARRESAPVPPPWAEDFPNITVMTSPSVLQQHGAYQAAKAGNEQAAIDVVFTYAKDQIFMRLKQEHPDAILVPVMAEERTGLNRLPSALVAYGAHVAGFHADGSIVQSTRAGRTGRNADYRMAQRAEFDGPVEAGRDYIIIDDVAAMGGTLGELRAYIEARGGRVVHMVTLAAAQFGAKIAQSPQTNLALTQKYDQAALRDFLREHGFYGGEPGALTEGEARWFLARRSLDEARDRIFAARVENESGPDAGNGRPPAQFARRGEVDPNADRTPEQVLRDYATLEALRDRVMAENDNLPNARIRDLNTQLSELRIALEEKLPGWRKVVDERKAQNQAEREAAEARGEAVPEPEPGATIPDPESIDPRLTEAKRTALEASTVPEVSAWKGWLESFKAILRSFHSSIPELPAGAEGRPFMNFRTGFRMLRAATESVRTQAEEQVAHILEPIMKLGREGINPKDYARLQRLQQTRRTELDAGRPIKPALDREIAELSAKLETLPYHLFRRAILYRDLYFRSRLANPQGEPLTLPENLTRAEVDRLLAEVHQQIDQSPHQEAITTAMRRHYELIAEVREDLLQRGYIIPEELRNPLYFPHIVVDKFNGQIARVRLDTAEDFRGYLQSLVGSAKAIEADYLTAMYYHLNQVKAHNARQDIVEQYWKPYDIAEQLKDEAKTLNAQRRDQGLAPLSWRQLIPADHVLYTVDDRLPTRPEYIVNRQVLAERLGVELGEGDLVTQLRQHGLDVTLTAEDFQAALAAGERQQWVVPKPVADALREIVRRESHTPRAVERAIRTPQSAWKRWILFAPHTTIRYNYNNLTTDFEKLFSVDPAVFRQLRPALHELREFYAGGKPSPDLAEAYRRGVIDGITANEVGELVRKPAAQFEAFLTSKDKFAQLLKRGRDYGIEFSRLREATFRLAKYRADLDRLRHGAEPIYAGAYRADVRAIQEPTPEATHHAQAAEISRKTFGDYSDLSVAGDQIRQHLMPFWSWTEVNFRYHMNLFRNMRDMATGDAFAQAGRLGVVAATKGARVVAGVMLRLAIPYVAVHIWNNTGDREDIEKDLSEEDRRRFHIVIGRDEQGRAIVVYAATALTDVMRWFNGNDFARLATEYARGDIGLRELVHEWAYNLPGEIINSLVHSIGPHLKAVYSGVSRKDPFPEVFDQRTIPDHDLVWNLLGNMTDGATAQVIRSVADKDFYSAKDFGDWSQQLILQARRRDPEQWGYYATLDRVKAYQADHGGTVDFGANNRDDAQVLASFRRTIRAGDIPAAVTFYQKLLEKGYTAERFAASVRFSDPLHTLKREYREDFIASLNEGEQRDLKNAYRYAQRMQAFSRRERMLFPSERASPAYRERFAAQGGRADVFAGIMQNLADADDAELEMRAERLFQRSRRAR